MNIIRSVTPRRFTFMTRTVLGGLLFLTTATACQTPSFHAPVPSWSARRDALAYVKQAVTTPENPVLRSQAIEALQEVAPDEGIYWFHQALEDQHEGVRFAACTALGEIRDQTAKAKIAKLLTDDRDSVKAAAIFALHRLGDVSHTHRLREFLLYHSQAAVRANTALLLGKLGEEDAVKLLRKALNDQSPAVRLQVFEAMVRLGDAQAGRQFSLHAHGGPGTWQVTALLALARTDLPNKVKLLRHRLQHAEHLETKLAAARGLGWCGLTDGYDVARRALDRSPLMPNRRNPDDDPGNQNMRIRSMAALALGAIGDERAVPALHSLLSTSPDSRVRLAAATGLLEVLNQTLPRLPFGEQAARGE